MRSGTRSSGVLLLLSLACASGPRGQLPPLLQPTERLADADALSPEVLMRSRNVTVDLRQLQPETRRLHIPLFDGESVNVAIDRQETLRTRAQQEGAIWSGRVEGQPGGFITLALARNVLAANLRMQDGRAYQIRPAGEKVYVLRQIDPSKLPPEGEPLTPRLAAREDDLDLCSTDPPTDIDVLVLYTDDARAAAKGTAAMEASIFLAVEEANLSYLNSHVDQRLRLAYMQEVSYDESILISEKHLVSLQGKRDGVLDDVHALRDTYAADVSVLVLEKVEPCGQAYVMDKVSSTFEEFGFAVVMLECATAKYTFAHELGHIMSARHEWFRDDKNNLPYAYNHGDFNSVRRCSAGGWRTMMAVQPGLERVPYWSNPNVTYPPGCRDGAPMGRASGQYQADNHRVLNATALTVANFRCSSPAARNVWMKDTWSDTGVEPDPRTAGEPMWASPYIWVRNARDTSLVHQHEHQNPVAGGANWVYVKLHNGGEAATSGELELYWAHASTSQPWPSTWHLVNRVRVNGFAAHSTRVVEAESRDFFSPGDYSLLARWISADDPMTIQETKNIHAYTRASNNVVWRNVSIVRLPPEASALPVFASFTVRSLEDRPRWLSFAIRPPSGETAESFISQGQLAVILDETLLEAWSRSRKSGKGFEIRGNRAVIIDPAGATLEKILLPPGWKEGQVFLSFTRLPETPKRRFRIDVMQFDSPVPGALSEAVGGIRYDIDTEIAQP